ncbi:MAG: hypothetical protein M1837_001466 [Sclerophora amabilis]|nr:MAG: hypothetical protein M1837_001466 [Sclerophora amabilis]
MRTLLKKTRKGLKKQFSMMRITTKEKQPQATTAEVNPIQAQKDSPPVTKPTVTTEQSQINAEEAVTQGTSTVAENPSMMTSDMTPPVGLQFRRFSEGIAVRGYAGGESTTFSSGSVAQTSS